MTSSEFSDAVDGVTAVRLEKIFGKSAGTIRLYKAGKQPIPVTVARRALRLRDALGALSAEREDDPARSMRRVINGVLYDTRSAACLGSREHGYPGDFDRVSEELYRTKTGRYFLAGSGGARSRYAESDGNDTTGGSDIIPVSESEARGWLSDYGSIAEYEAVFGPIPEA